MKNSMCVDLNIANIGNDRFTKVVSSKVASCKLPIEKMVLGISAEEESTTIAESPLKLKLKDSCVTGLLPCCSSDSPMSITSNSSVTLSNVSADCASYDGSPKCFPALSALLDSASSDDGSQLNNKNIDTSVEESFSHGIFCDTSSCLHQNTEKANINGQYYAVSSSSLYNNAAFDAFSSRSISLQKDMSDSPSSSSITSAYPPWFFPLPASDDFLTKADVSLFPAAAAFPGFLKICKNPDYTTYDGSLIQLNQTSATQYADLLTKLISTKQHCRTKLHMLRSIFPVWANHAESYRWHWRKIMGCKDSMLASYMVIFAQLPGDESQDVLTAYVALENTIKRNEFTQVLQDLDELRIMEDKNFAPLVNYVSNSSLNSNSVDSSISIDVATSMWNISDDEPLMGIKAECKRPMRTMKDCTFLENYERLKKTSFVHCPMLESFLGNDKSSSDTDAISNLPSTGTTEKRSRLQDEQEVEKEMNCRVNIENVLNEAESTLLSSQYRSVSVSSVGSCDDPTRPRGGNWQNRKKNGRIGVAETSVQSEHEENMKNEVTQHQLEQQMGSAVYEFKERSYSKRSSLVDDASNENISYQKSSIQTSLSTSNDGPRTRGKQLNYADSLSSSSDCNLQTARRIKPGIIYTSKIAGVSWRSTPVPLWRCRWKDPVTGRDLSKCFSIKKYGFENAKRMAEEWVMRIRQDILFSVKLEAPNSAGTDALQGIKQQPDKQNESVFNNTPFDSKCGRFVLSDILRGVRYHNRSRAWIGLYKVGDLIKEKYFSVSKLGYNQAMEAANKFTLQNFCPEKSGLLSMSECDIKQSIAGGTSYRANEIDVNELSENHISKYLKVAHGSETDDRLSSSLEEVSKYNQETETYGNNRSILSLEQPTKNSLPSSIENLNANNFFSDFQNNYSNGNWSFGNITTDHTLLKNSEKFVSDVQGVIFDHGCNSWRAYWTDPDSGRQLARRFSVRKYGINKSRMMAESVRKAVERFRGRLPYCKIKNEGNCFDIDAEQHSILCNETDYLSVDVTRTGEHERSPSLTVTTQSNATISAESAMELQYEHYKTKLRENGSSITMEFATNQNTPNVQRVEDVSLKQKQEDNNKESNNCGSWSTRPNNSSLRTLEGENGSVSTASNSEEAETNTPNKAYEMAFRNEKRLKVEEIPKRDKTKVECCVESEDSRQKQYELYAGQILHLQRIKKDGKLLVAEVIFAGPRRVRVRWIEGCTDTSIVGAEQHINLCDFWHQYQRVNNNSRRVVA